MNKFDELVNDYTIAGDDGAVIFSSFDQFLEFVEEIRQMEREACAAKWVRDNYQDYKNIADICEAILARGEK